MSSETMDFEARTLLLILLGHITVSVSGTQLFPVSCRKQTICALKASSVDLTCSYSNINITTGFWFNVQDKAKWRKEEHPEDLALDSDYAGRVNYVELTNFSSTLTITDLRERDSGEYHLMLITDKGEKCLSSTGVNLTVTDLQVTYDTHMTPQQQALTCHTSCLLTIKFQRYHWYKNGQYLEQYTDNMDTFSVSNADKGSYSCSVHGYNDILSRLLCVGGNCWNVTYTNIRVCVLEGSSVAFAGSYSHPSDWSVKGVYWHSYKDFQDLKKDTQFLKRVEYVNKNRDSTLKMIRLTRKDSEEYRLRIINNNGKGFSGRPGVVLSVTDLQVRVSDSTAASEGQTAVTLSCITSCTLSNNPTYIWYKNGQRVTDKLTKHNKLYLISFEDAGNYSCAVRGREDLRSPEQPVTLLGEGEIAKGQPFGPVKNVAITVGVLVCLSLIIIAGALWMCRRKSRSVKSPTSTVDPKPQTEQSLSHQDDVHYSSIHFPSRTQGSTLSPGGRFPVGAAEDECVQYAEVNIKRPMAAT